MEYRDLKERFYSLKEISTDPDLQKYNEELEEDLRITKLNIIEKSQMTCSLKSKWLNYLTFEKENNLKKLIQFKEKYTKSKISSKNINDPLIRMKSEVALENGDEKLTKVNEMIKNTKARIDYLERACDIVSDLTFSIKNAVEMYKLEGMR